jgi:hypothetical protein
MRHVLKSSLRRIFAPTTYRRHPCAHIGHQDVRNDGRIGWESGIRWNTGSNNQSIDHCDHPNCSTHRRPVSQRSEQARTTGSASPSDRTTSTCLPLLRLDDPSISIGFAVWFPRATGLCRRCTGQYQERRETLCWS